jgi:hypothetical protein
MVGPSFFLAQIHVHMATPANALVDALAKQLVGSGWIYQFLPFQRFTDMCLDVYFNDNHSEANFITVNAGLYSLFWDYSFQVVPQEKDECITHAHLCRDNLETVLSNLPLHLSATSDTILALLFGVCNLFIDQKCLC